MIIAATSDIHLPNNYREFVKSVDDLDKRPDLFLIAGDVVHHGDVNEYEKFYNAIFGEFSCPIAACFGNNEFQQTHADIISKFTDIKFLDDESGVFSAGGKKVGVFGTTGSLETPTSWQAANIPNIEEIYRQRVEVAGKAMKEMEADYKIFLTHYAPTYVTLEGENPRFFSTLGSRAYEDVIESAKPDLVIHGHSQHGKKLAWLDSVPVFNVAFRMNKNIVIIDTSKLKPGLSRFL